MGHQTNLMNESFPRMDSFSPLMHHDKSGLESLITVLTDLLLANGDEPNLILPKFARPL